MGVDSFGACLKIDDGAAATLANKSGCSVENFAELVHDTLSRADPGCPEPLSTAGFPVRDLDVYEDHLV